KHGFPIVKGFEAKRHKGFRARDASLELPPRAAFVRAPSRRFSVRNAARRLRYGCVVGGHAQTPRGITVQSSPLRIAATLLASRGADTACLRKRLVSFRSYRPEAFAQHLAGESPSPAAPSPASARASSNSAAAPAGHRTPSRLLATYRYIPRLSAEGRSS